MQTDAPDRWSTVVGLFYWPGSLATYHALPSIALGPAFVGAMGVGQHGVADAGADVVHGLGELVLYLRSGRTGNDATVATCGRRVHGEPYFHGGAIWARPHGRDAARLSSTEARFPHPLAAPSTRSSTPTRTATRSSVRTAPTAATATPRAASARGSRTTASATSRRTTGLATAGATAARPGL